MGMEVNSTGRRVPLGGPAVAPAPHPRGPPHHHLGNEQQQASRGNVMKTSYLKYSSEKIHHIKIKLQNKKMHPPSSLGKTKKKIKTLLSPRDKNTPADLWQLRVLKRPSRPPDLTRRLTGT